MTSTAKDFKLRKMQRRIHKEWRKHRYSNERIQAELTEANVQICSNMKYFIHQNTVEYHIKRCYSFSVLSTQITTTPVLHYSIIRNVKNSKVNKIKIIYYNRAPASTATNVYFHYWKICWLFSWLIVKFIKGQTVVKICHIFPEPSVTFSFSYISYCWRALWDSCICPSPAKRNRKHCSSFFTFHLWMWPSLITATT